MQPSPDVLQYGGFAFAAFVLAGMLIFFARIFATFLEKREQFIDRLLERDELTSAEHHALAAAVTLNAESTKQLAGTVADLGRAVTESLKELTQEVRGDRMDRARQRGGL